MYNVLVGQRIYPVLVLFKVKLIDSLSYRTLIKPNKIEHFFVYDNSPEDFYQPSYRKLEGMTYVRDYDNGGLSKAYNIGAFKARELGFSHVLFLDQDTQFDLQAWKEYNKYLSFPGIIAPIVRTTQGQEFSPVDLRGWNLKGIKNPQSGVFSLYNLAVVNSGSCIPLTLYEKSGGYKDSVRLDFSDFQFQLRVRSLESRFFLLNTVALQDFSNDIKDVNVLLYRFSIYLECGAAFTPDSQKLYFKHHYQVFRHAFALTVRTHNIKFLTNYIKIFILKRK